MESNAFEKSVRDIKANVGLCSGSVVICRGVFLKKEVSGRKKEMGVDGPCYCKKIPPKIYHE